MFLSYSHLFHPSYSLYLYASNTIFTDKKNHEDLPCNHSSCIESKISLNATLGLESLQNQILLVNLHFSSHGLLNTQNVGMALLDDVLQLFPS